LVNSKTKVYYEQGDRWYDKTTLPIIAANCTVIAGIRKPTTSRPTKIFRNRGLLGSGTLDAHGLGFGDVEAAIISRVTNV